MHSLFIGSLGIVVLIDGFESVVDIPKTASSRAFLFCSLTRLNKSVFSSSEESSSSNLGLAAFAGEAAFFVLQKKTKLRDYSKIKFYQ